MKVYNYSDTPVNINGHNVTDTVLFLDNEIRKPFVTHNGYEFLSNHNNESRNEVYTIINDSAGGSYKYYTDSVEVPDVTNVVMLMITVFGFYLTIRVLQKIKQH